jgi:hypothetical protein
MAHYAILEVANAFLKMQRTHPCLLVFMAAIARIPAEVVLDVARRAFRVVVTVQKESACMVKG